ncbi:MAG: patatin-like phospholipase family protein [Pseudomonadota bacterium]
MLRFLALIFVVLLVSCASRPQETEEFRTTVPQEAVDTISLNSYDASLVDDDGVHTVLALSAGGAEGAFGAGVLAGWTKSGQRPKFDVVTGVSTGSLLAVFAFLGPQNDELIRELYTTQTNETIFRQRGLTGILSDSLYDNGPLQNQIETHITASVLDKIAVEHRKGRRLYIATTNLDAGELIIWDMGQIATGEAGGRSNSLQHFQKVLRASAAVPGFFQPVYIKPLRGVQLRQAHVDGGVKEPVLYSNFMAKSSAKDRRLYMVINGTTRRYNSSYPVEPKLASIAQKTIFEMMRELQQDTIFRHFVNSKNNGVDFYLTSIPDTITPAQKSLNFNLKRMQKLYRAGFEIGANGLDDWVRQPPEVSREKVKVSIQCN